MRAPLYAAMSDAAFWGWTAVACLTLWFAICMFAVALCRAAAKPAPRHPEAQVVAEAEAIVRSAS